MTEEKKKSIQTKENWYTVSIQETLRKFKTTRDGLSRDIVAKRQKKYGFNIMPKKKPLSQLVLFLNQFKSSFVYILLVAAGISFMLEEMIDGSIILLAVVINVIVGFFQERKAQQALAALQQIITSHARVRRSGNIQLIGSNEVVPGDLVLLEAGDKVPADMRLIETNDLLMTEASLTGESKAVEKQANVLSNEQVLGDQSNMAFMSTVVARGTGTGVVVATGINTEIGRIARLVKDTKDEPTPLQRKLDRFSKRLAVMVLGLSLLIFISGLLTRFSIGEMFTTSVAVAVAAIPEGLVVALTVILAIGMRRILKENGLVKQLLAAETLGSTSVICSDKTGTLTQGEMRVARIVGSSEVWDSKDNRRIDMSSAEFGLIMRIIMLCNNAFMLHPLQGEDKKEMTVSGSPTEKAFLLAGSNADLDHEKLKKQYPRLDEIPFDSKHKYMMTLHKYSDKENIIYLKGAPEKVLDFCSYIYKAAHASERHARLTPQLQHKEKQQYEKMSSEGLRVLSVAYKKVPSSLKSFKELFPLPRRGLMGGGIKANNDIVDRPPLAPYYKGVDGKDFVFVGFIGLRDPLRPDARHMVEVSRSAGVETVMITGDHKLTAQAIAKDLGLPYESRNIITGQELVKLSSSQLKKRVPELSVYARVSPEDKLKIINAWQSRGQVVAMTGDGVNDAPALKKADIGVAVGSGTDVAKETADLILLDNDFKTIVSAIKQGRVIYDNVKKVILYFLSDSFTEMIVIVVGLLLGWPLPILASQILWVNLVDDTLPSLALTQEPEEPEIMTEPPADRNAPIIGFEPKFLIVLISIVTALDTLLLFWFFWQGNPDNLMHARSVAFVTLGVDSLLYIFSVRTLRKPIWKTNLFSNKALIWSVILSFIAQIAAVYVPGLQIILRTVPLSLSDWAIIALVSLAVISIIEITKWLFIKHVRKLRKPVVQSQANP